jgi:hypothetical protein
MNHATDLCLLEVAVVERVHIVLLPAEPPGPQQQALRVDGLPVRLNVEPELDVGGAPELLQAGLGAQGPRLGPAGVIDQPVVPRGLAPAAQMTPSLRVTEERIRIAGDVQLQCRVWEAVVEAADGSCHVPLADEP